MSPVRGRWIETCGCERRTYVKNLRYVVRGGSKPCDAPHPHDPDDLPSVATEAGWCGCGDHDDVDRWMLAYLESLTPDWPAPVGIPTEAAVLLAYVAAELDWTEHGSSIRFPWLTDNGRLVLKELRSRADPLMRRT